METNFCGVGMDSLKLKNGRENEARGLIDLQPLCVVCLPLLLHFESTRWPIMICALVQVRSNGARFLTELAILYVCIFPPANNHGRPCDSHFASPRLVWMRTAESTVSWERDFEPCLDSSSFSESSFHFDKSVGFVFFCFQNSKKISLAASEVVVYWRTARKQEVI